MACWRRGRARPSRRSLWKLLRPSLLLLVVEALGAPIDRALSPAAALELIHDFSLIHDDIQDADRTRRGRPALWTQIGISQAINAGDWLFAMALSEALRTDPGTSEIILDAARQLIEGQALDLALAPASADLAAYLRMIDRKTGALFACALEVGAIVGGAVRPEVEALRALGLQLGRAFQMHDDMMELETGPPADGDKGSDLAKRRFTLPVVLALDGRGADAEALRAMYATGSSAKPMAIREQLLRMGIPELAGEHLSAQLSRVRTMLNVTPLRGAAQEMEEFLDALTPPCG